MTKPLVVKEVRHGTHLGYMQDGCREECCLSAYRLYRKKLRIKGEGCLRPSSEAKVIIDRIVKARSITLTQLACHVDISDNCLYDIVNQTQKHTRTRVIEELLRFERTPVKLDTTKSMSLDAIRDLSLKVRLHGYSLELMSREAGFEDKYLRTTLLYNNNISYKNFFALIQAGQRLLARPFRNCFYGRKVRAAAFAEADLKEASAG
jgi:hypothetical protein